MTKFEVGKTYKTRNGKNARIIANDIKQSSCVAAAIDMGNDFEHVFLYDEDGHLSTFEEDGYDLIPPRREFWIVRTDDGRKYVLDHPNGMIETSAKRPPPMVIETIHVVEADE